MQRFLLAMLLACSTTSLATTVYKTVDENGVVSFSDTPTEADAEVVKIATPPAQSPEKHLADLEAMRETTDRMAEDRREREKHRAELRQLAAQNSIPQYPVQPVSNDYYYPIYSPRYPGNGRPPYHPGHRPEPEHPIARPPLLPDSGPVRPNNSQLMRPMLTPHR